MNIPIGPYNGNNVKHGWSNTPTYNTWWSMICRVRSNTKKSKKYYLDAGIQVCERWKKFENFLMDMGLKPDGHCIDRIDNSKGYEPGNCRWATFAENNGNRRQSVRIKYNGEELWLCEWARRLSVSHTTLSDRIDKQGVQFAFSSGPFVKKRDSKGRVIGLV